ncbi:MAG TPA: response regulator [Planctomycetota bacterium]|nr:response regulator [Planctomycetota bacterium]
MRVLIIDDSQAMRRLERDVLAELSGVEVIEAADGVGAIYKMQEHDFQVDLILVDWVMPRMDGLTFVKLMKAHPNLRNIPILMVTSCSDESKMKLASRFGVDGYLLKPFTKDLFLRAIVSLTIEFTDEVHALTAEESRSDGKSFLFDLPQELRNRIIDMSVMMEVAKEAPVLSPGDVPQCFYFVEAGMVEEHQPGIGGNSHLVRRYGPGECFGVTDLMAGDPVRCKFVAAVPSTIGRLPQVVFEGMLEKFPRINLTLSRCLATKARLLDLQDDKESSDLSGGLEVLDLPTLIQAVSLRQKTCVIELPEMEASIAFLCGQVISVQKRGSNGNEAFFEIMAEQPTRFRLVVKPENTLRNIHVSTSKLLLEWAQRIDDEQRAGVQGIVT